MMKTASLERRFAVVLVMVALLSTLATALAGVYAGRELFAEYVLKSGSQQAQNYALIFSSYFQEHGGFAGLQQEFTTAQHGKGYGRMGGGGSGSGNQILLVDNDGRVIWDAAGSALGLQLTPDQISTGVPVLVEGQTVGTVVGKREDVWGLGSLENDFLSSLTLYSITIGLLAALAALFFGLVLARPIVRPLHNLSLATHRLAEGDLDVRVPEQGDGELFKLARDFNKMAESLKRTDTMRKNFTADIAHELRTPLTILRANLEALQRQEGEIDQAVVASLNDEIIRMSKLVKDMETLALAETGNLILHKSEIDFDALIEKLQPVFMEINERGMVLDLKIEPGLPGISIDTDRIVQVMLNLLSNALKHSPAGGIIGLEVKRGDGVVQVSISDQGEGISPEQIPLIFERFYRKGDARTRSLGGMGLGLAIARTFVEAHGGKIWAESMPGRGSIFYMNLPDTQS